VSHNTPPRLCTESSVHDTDASQTVLGSVVRDSEAASGAEGHLSDKKAAWMLIVLDQFQSKLFLPLQ
jgi:hypothetical protein